MAKQSGEKKLKLSSSSSGGGESKSSRQSRKSSQARSAVKKPRAKSKGKMPSVYSALLNWLTVDLGVDMGATRTRIYLKGQGVVLDEPSYIAVSYRTMEPLCVGEEAFKMFGRCPPHVEVYRPVSQGVIDNFDLAEEMLRRFLDQVFKRKALLGARIAMVVPAGATDVEKKAFEDIAIQVGGREVFLVEAPVAAAVGMGLQVQKERTLVIMQFGGASTQAVVFTSGEVLFSHFEPVGGDSLTEAVVNGIRKKHKVHVGLQTAERLKIEMGSAFPTEKDETREIYGKGVENGLPKSVLVSNWEIREMMQGPLDLMVQAITSALERVPPELAEDIKRSGLYVAGGSSSVKGFSRLIEEITGLKVKTYGNPKTACIAGAEAIIKSPAAFKDLTASSHSRQFTG